MLRNGSFEGSGEWGSEAGFSTGRHAAPRESREHVADCERVHRTLQRIVKARGALDLQEAAALRDAQRLQIWRQFGFASLLEYMEREMGYTPRAALQSACASRTRSRICR